MDSSILASQPMNWAVTISMRISINNSMAVISWRLLLGCIVTFLAFFGAAWASEPFLEKPFVDNKTNIVLVSDCYVKSGESKFYFYIDSTNTGYLLRRYNETYHGAAQVFFENGSRYIDLGTVSESENYRLAVDRFIAANYSIFYRKNLTLKNITESAEKSCT